ncbi:MAG: hypothetical protein SGI77_21825 [Pirellulaceae bacterium]|nr:hypothetical protein [Pirellulaceae bacterium]
MRKKRPIQSKSSPSNMRAWLPIGITVFLAMVAFAKWSLASWIGAESGRDKNANRMSLRSIRPEMLFGETDSAIDQMVQGGVWSVADSIWLFENQSVDSQQLGSEIRFASQAVTAIESDLPEHLAILDLVPAERALVQQVGEQIVRSIDFGSVKGSVCYRETDGHRFVIGAKVANRQQDDEHWQVITLTPRRTASSKNDHLLPDIGSSLTACQRFSKSGSLQCEIIEIDRPFADLLNGWRSSGWVVEALSSDESQGNAVWSCMKGDCFIHLRATLSPDHSNVTLVLTALDRI